MPITPGAGEAGKARYEALSTTDSGTVDSPDESKPATRVVRHPLIAKGTATVSLYKMTGFSIRFYYTGARRHVEYPGASMTFVACSLFGAVFS